MDPGDARGLTKGILASIKLAEAVVTWMMSSVASLREPSSWGKPMSKF